MKFKYTFFFLFFTALCAAQSPKKDSLMGIIRQSKEDKKQVDALVEYAWEIMGNENERPDRSLHRANQIAKKLNYKKGSGDALNALGVFYSIKGNTDSSIICYELALPIRLELGDTAGVASIHNNLANGYGDLHQDSLALYHHDENINLRRTLKDTSRLGKAYFGRAMQKASMQNFEGAFIDATQYRILADLQNSDADRARAFGLLGDLRFESELYEEALKWYENALKLKRKQDDSLSIAAALNNVGNAKSEIESLRSSALIDYQEALNIYENDGGDEEGVAHVLHNLASLCIDLKQYEQGEIYLKRSWAIRKNYDNVQYWFQYYETLGDLLADKKEYKKSLEIVKSYLARADSLGDKKWTQKGYKDISKIYAKLGDFETAYEFRKKYDELRYEILNEIRNDQIQKTEAAYGDSEKKRKIEQQTLDLKLSEEQLKRDKIQKRAFLAGGIGIAAIALLLFYLNRVRAKSNAELDRLLKNILPESTAEELKKHNKVAPVRYESVSVLFTDFKSFTTIAETMDPEDLVAELDASFRLFDEIVERHGLEKIKTIGDAYMCAGGLPNVNSSHPVDAVEAALEMQAALINLMKSRNAEGRPVFEMRVGIHTGPVVAGVVGSHKFAYDIWGDTVNTASRMESNSEPGRVNISASTYALVKDRFTCTYRGKLEAKNKGAIDMFFVE